MGKASRKKKSRNTDLDYILQHTTGGLIESMREVVVNAKKIKAKKVFGRFEKGYDLYEIHQLAMWMLDQEISLDVLVRHRETGQFVSLNHDPSAS